MNYLTMAKIKIAGRPFVVCECRLLENIEACTNKAIEKMDNVSCIQSEDYEVLNPTKEFISDLDKIMNKISHGDTSRYFRGDFSKYYITDFEKIVDMFNAIESKTIG